MKDANANAIFNTHTHILLKTDARNSSAAHKKLIKKTGNNPKTINTIPNSLIICFLA